MEIAMRMISGSIGVSNTCTAFEGKAIGSRVTNTNLFVSYLLDILEIEKKRRMLQDITGINTFEFPNWWPINQFVSSGVGFNSTLPEDYVLREWRGLVKPFLRRSKALPVGKLKVVLYSKETYLSDPDVMRDETYWKSVKANEGLKLVIVAVIASSGPHSPLSPEAFIHNMAGGNLDFIPKTDAAEYQDPVEAACKKGLSSMSHDIKMLHSWISQAKEIEKYRHQYSIVAD